MKYHVYKSINNDQQRKTIDRMFNSYKEAETFKAELYDLGVYYVGICTLYNYSGEADVMTIEEALACSHLKELPTWEGVTA